MASVLLMAGVIFERGLIIGVGFMLAREERFTPRRDGISAVCDRGNVRECERERLVLGFGSLYIVIPRAASCLIQFIPLVIIIHFPLRCFILHLENRVHQSTTQTV